MRQHFLAVWLLIVLVVGQTQQTDATKQPPDSLVSTASVIEPAETQRPKPISFLIIPGEQVGPIKKDATESGLIALLGAANVKRDTFHIVDGTIEIGTTLYKNTIDEAIILWRDTGRFARPMSVLIHPNRDENSNLIASDPPRWVTDRGLKIGQSLQAVEKVNGRSFSLYGFGGEQPGHTTSWKGGLMDELDGYSYISLSFGIHPTLPDSHKKLYESLSGNQEFLSSNPAMQQLNPTIQNLTILFK